MGRIATELLPEHAELARRAAGGDGAAFVRLFDHYFDEVFDAALAATGEAGAAADATQLAFLQTLRRPPALGAPATEVAERLSGMALAAVGQAAPTAARRAQTRQSPAAYGVGWVRSETVAKAGARFDSDWSIYLNTGREPAREGIASERPVLAATPPSPVVAPVAAAPERASRTAFMRRTLRRR